MQCLYGLVEGPYFILFSRIGFNLKVLILGVRELRPTCRRYSIRRACMACLLVSELVTRRSSSSGPMDFRLSSVRTAATTSLIVVVSTLWRAG
jgi:hypothetical protein